MTNKMAKNIDVMGETAEMLADALAYSVLLRNSEDAGETVDPEILALAKSMAMNALNCYWIATGTKVEL